MLKLLALSLSTFALVSAAHAGSKPVRTFHCQGSTSDKQAVKFDVDVTLGRRYTVEPKIEVDRDYMATATLTYLTPGYGAPVKLEGSYGEHFRIVNYRQENEDDTNIMEYRLLLDGAEGSPIRQLNSITAWDYTKGEHYAQYTGNVLMLQQVGDIIHDVQCEPADKFRGGRPRN